jgi:hypothetical protein
MLIHLHSQAKTTPRVRAAIQESDEAGRAFRCDGADDLQVAQARQRRGSQPHAAPAADHPDACPGGRGGGVAKGDIILDVPKQNP